MLSEVKMARAGVAVCRSSVFGGADADANVGLIELHCTREHGVNQDQDLSPANIGQGQGRSTPSGQFRNGRISNSTYSRNATGKDLLYSQPSENEIVFRTMPTPSISTSTTSPSLRNSFRKYPTPAGVPVIITVPLRSVVPRDKWLII